VLRAARIVRHHRRSGDRGEQILPDLDQLDRNATNAVLSDLMMLALGGAGTAQERTAPEYAELLASAGFDVTRILELEEGFSAIEARAV
jgi:hypothetical protein